MKVFLGVVAAFAALMVLLFITPFVVPTTHYKEAFIDEVKKFADGEVTIDSFRFQILPYPAFTVRGLNTPIFHAAVVQGGLSPAPLFRGKIVADFLVKDAVFDYRVAPDGVSNWSVLKRAGEDAHRGNYEIRSLIITNGAFRYIKNDVEKPFVIDQIELATSDLKFDTESSASVRMSAVVEGAIKQTLNLSGALAINKAQRLFEAKQLDIFYGGSRFNVNGTFRYDTKVLDAHIATASVTLQTLGNVVPAIMQGVPIGVELAGPFALDTALSGTWDNLSVKCHIDATTSKIRFGSVFTKEAMAPFKMVFAGVYQPTYITIDDLSLSIDENTFHLMGSIVNQPGYPAQLTLSSTTFDANKLKRYFPFLNFFNELADPAVAINVQGALIQDAERMITGHVSASKATALGHTLLNFETDFQYATDVITLSMFKGLLYDGTLSGNGSINLQSTPALHFEFVADNIDTAKIQTLPAMLSGPASLVFKADASGQTLSSEGTLVMPTGQIAPLKIGMQVFNDTVWNMLEPYIPGGLDPLVRGGLAALEGEVKDLKASFNFKDSILSIGKIEWSHPQYQAAGQASINLTGEVSGDGSVFVSKDSTAKLIKDPAVRKTVTNTEGMLEIPFVVSGTMIALSVRPNDTRFADNLKRTAVIVQTAPQPPPPAPEVKPKKAPQVAAKEKPESAKTVKPLKKRVPKAPAKGKMSTDVDEDSLKVIIGQ